MHCKTKPSRLALGFSLVLFSPLLTDSQSLRERQDRIRGFSERGDTAAAIKELEALHNSSKAVFAANNYDYLLGRLSERKGDPVGATKNYQTVIRRDSVLSQYALWHLSQIARATGDFVLERERLRQLITLAPSSLLRDAATTRLARSFFESADFESAIYSLRPVTESKRTSVAREALALLGQAYLRAGKLQEAHDTFTKLVMQMPDASRPDDFALSAVKGLDTLDNSGPATTPQLSEAEHLLRASIYQFNRDFAGARIHYQAITADNSGTPALANAIYQIGRGFFLEGRLEEAFESLQRLNSPRFPEDPAKRDAIILTGSVLARQGKTDQAVYVYKWFIGHYPDAPNPERPYLSLIDALRDAGRNNEALDWVQQTRTRFKDQIGATLALFARAKLHLAQASWEAALADLNELQKASELGGTLVPGGTTASEVTFLRAYALEQLGKGSEAIDAYLLIPEGRHEYYGYRATQRLGALGSNPQFRELLLKQAESLGFEAGKALQNGQAEEARRLAQKALRLTENEAAKGEALKILKRAYDALPAYRLPAFKLIPLGRKDLVNEPRQTSVEPTHQAIAEELLFLGLYDEGTPEFAVALAEAHSAVTGGPLSEAAKTTPGQTDLDYTLAVYFLRAGLANRAIRFAEQIWKTIPGDYLLEFAPREMLELLYPAPFRESVLKHAPAKGIDPRFVLAIARQESRFQPDAKSVAAARGMMQFIPSTADNTVKQLGTTAFQQDDLYNPDIAILFGSQYLSALFKQFPNQFEAVAASYNGGPENVRRWIVRAHSNEPDRYIPELGFSQTKDYVFKVMSNFWVYQRQFSEQLQPR